MTKVAKIVEYVNFLGNGYIDGPGQVSVGLAYAGPRDRRQAQTGAKMVPGPMENAAPKMRVSVLGEKTMAVVLMSQAAVGLNHLAEQAADGEESDDGRHGNEFLDAAEVQTAVALTGEQFRFFATAADFIGRLTFQEDMDEVPRTARTKMRPDAEKIAAGAALVLHSCSRRTRTCKRPGDSCRNGSARDRSSSTSQRRCPHRRPPKTASTKWGTPSRCGRARMLGSRAWSALGMAARPPKQQVRRNLGQRPACQGKQQSCQPSVVPRRRRSRAGGW